jgi:diguanylate cyclase (GGDEF)-like protein
MTSPVRHGTDTELRSMFARVADLERERGDARDQVRSLSHLHVALSRLATERDRTSIARVLLETAHEPLGFARAALLEVAECSVRVRYLSTVRDGFAEVDEVLEQAPGGALERVIEERCDDEIGYAGELGAPLVDTRGWYGLVALRGGEPRRGILYVDDHRSAHARDWEIGLVRTLATIGSVALENADLIGRLEALATRDPLTGLLNRRAFSERLDQAIDAARRGGRALAFALIDVDDFKSINDTRGHAHGDYVLKNLARVLTSQCRAHDVAGRFAGDEFVTLLCDIEPSLAQQMIARLSRALADNEIRCSIGVALYPRDARDATSLLEASDRALYAAKAAGKNTFAFVS